MPRNEVCDRLGHGLPSKQNVVIPEPQNAKSSFRQITVTVLIAFNILAAIRLDDQMLFEANKIYDPGSDAHLPVKFQLSKPSRSQQSAQRDLGIRRLCAKHLREAPLWSRYTLAHPLTRLATLATLSRKGRGY
jgi:hypothetical protein